MHSGRHVLERPGHPVAAMVGAALRSNGDDRVAPVSEAREGAKSVHSGAKRNKSERGRQRDFRHTHLDRAHRGWTRQGTKTECPVF
jgi:hypothetical protein